MEYQARSRCVETHSSTTPLSPSACPNTNGSSGARASECARLTAPPANIQPNSKLGAMLPTISAATLSASTQPRGLCRAHPDSRLPSLHCLANTPGVRNPPTPHPSAHCREASLILVVFSAGLQRTPRRSECPLLSKPPPPSPLLLSLLFVMRADPWCRSNRGLRAPVLARPSLPALGFPRNTPAERDKETAHVPAANSLLAAVFRRCSIWQ